MMNNLWKLLTIKIYLIYNTLVKRVSGWCKDIKTLSEEGLGVNRVFALRCN